MKQEKKAIRNLYGRVLMPSQSCDECLCDEGCCKVFVEHVGHVCLVEQSEVIKKEKSLTAEYASTSDGRKD